MSANSFGQIFKITSFGESHGAALGVVVEGCPAGVVWDENVINDFVQRRRPGHGKNVSPRREDDEFEVLSGVFETKTLGTPIAIIVRNHDVRSSDYNTIKKSPRPGHADDTWRDKFGHIDHRGGGRSSGRETVARVLGGAVAKMFLQQALPNLTIRSTVTKVGPLLLDEKGRHPELDSILNQAQRDGNSYGGEVLTQVTEVPRGLGQPVFRKLKADLAAAMMSIGAVTGFSLGAGFAAAEAEGTEFHGKGEMQNYGGIRGGISTGEPIVFKVPIKPTSSILDVAKSGRHDPCVALRAAVVVEAMTQLVLADHLLWRRLDRIGLESGI